MGGLEFLEGAVGGRTEQRRLLSRRAGTILRDDKAVRGQELLERSDIGAAVAELEVAGKEEWWAWRDWYGGGLWSGGSRKMNQMRENLSLFSFWGLIFAVAALAVFVVVYVHKNMVAHAGKNDMIDDLRRHSVAVYLGAESRSSADISHKLRDAGDEIERLRSMNFLMFWLIVAMNTVVIGLLLIGYRTF